MCEEYQEYFAMKQKDLKKLDGRDHLVLEVKTRDLLIDFLDELAESE